MSAPKGDPLPYTKRTQRRNNKPSLDAAGVLT